MSTGQIVYPDRVAEAVRDYLDLFGKLFDDKGPYRKAILKTRVTWKRYERRWRKLVWGKNHAIRLSPACTQEMTVWYHHFFPDAKDARPSTVLAAVVGAATSWRRPFPIPRSEIGPQNVSHWGRKYTVTPAVVGRVFGDGRQLISFVDMNRRPNYYLVRIDSGWNLENCARDRELFIDHTDEVIDAILDEYGPSYCEEEEDREAWDDCDKDGYRPFPAWSGDVGYSWGLVKATKPPAKPDYPLPAPAGRV